MTSNVSTPDDDDDGDSGDGGGKRKQEGRERRALTSGAPLAAARYKVVLLWAVAVSEREREQNTTAQTNITRHAPTAKTALILFLSEEKANLFTMCTR